MNNIILGTGSFDTVKSGNVLSISSDRVDFEPAYRRLSPKPETYNPYREKIKELQELKQDLTQVKKYLELKKQIEDEYIENFYMTRLSRLNIYDLYEKLNKKYGTDIILLCSEGIDEFCHRRIVADYIELKTGIYIPEVSVDEDGKIKKHVPIRYKKRLQKIINNSYYI